MCLACSSLSTGGGFGQARILLTQEVFSVDFCTVFEGAVTQVPSEFSRPNLGVIGGVDLHKSDRTPLIPG